MLGDYIKTVWDLVTGITPARLNNAEDKVKELDTWAATGILPVWEHIGTDVLASAAASISRSGLDDYVAIKAHLSNAKQTAGNHVVVTFNSDTTAANYSCSYYEAVYTDAGALTSSGVYATAFYPPLSQYTNHRGPTGGVIWVDNTAGLTRHPVLYSSVGIGNGGTHNVSIEGGGFWLSSARITSMEIVGGGGNLLAGTTVVWEGVRE